MQDLTEDITGLCANYQKGRLPETTDLKLISACDDSNLPTLALQCLVRPHDIGDIGSFAVDWTCLVMTITSPAYHRDKKGCTVAMRPSQRL
jgi:hypothetical protein